LGVKIKSLQSSGIIIDAIALKPGQDNFTA
jgi:hypothetical protein